MPSVLHTIRKRAVEIQKRHPGKKYQTALKEAGKEYRQGKIGKAKKVGKKKAHYVPVKAEHCRRIGAVADQTLAQSISIVRKRLEAELGWLLLGRDQAIGVMNKRKYNKKIVDVRRKLRALS